MIASRRRKTVREPTIALINIVFLILIFFMVTGSLSKPPNPSLDLVSSEGLECCAPSDALTISAAGELSYFDETFASEQQFLARNRLDGAPLKILPDRALPASQLLKIMGVLQASGAEKIILLTEFKQ